MNRYLIDTNILIYASKADEKAITFMRQLFNDKTKVFLCSVITEAELFSKTTNNEVKGKMKALLNEAIIIEINSDIARKAGGIRASGEDNGYKIKLPDALIVATAIIENATLVTHNPVDFLKINEFENLNILDPMGDR